VFVLFALLCGVTKVEAQTSQRPLVSVLDLGAQPIARQVAETLRERLRSSGDFNVADADLSRAAAKGIGYSGSLNLTASEARDLGAAPPEQSITSTPAYATRHCGAAFSAATSEDT